MQQRSSIRKPPLKLELAAAVTQTYSLTQRDKIPLNPLHTQKCSQAPPKICLYLALIHDCSSCMETALKCLPNQTGWTQLQWSVWRGRINKVMTTGAFWEQMDRKSEQTCGHSSHCLDGLPVNWKLLHFSPNCLTEISTTALSETDMNPGRAASYSSVSVLFFISHWTHPHLVFLCNMLFLTFSYFFFPLLQSECADTVAAWPALGNQTSVHTLHIRALLSLGQYKQNLSPPHFLSRRASNNGTQNKTNTIVNAL